jgi:PAS domain S-box-containing protein
MKERLSSKPGISRIFPSWPAALIGIVVIKAVLSLALKPGSMVFSYSGVSYLFLLVLASGFAIRNGMQKTLGSRAFWIFLAIAYGLWAVHQSFYVYYELGRDLAVPITSDPVLFLHTVAFMAALACLPHRNQSDHRPYGAILDSLFLLFFWSFFYGYTVFPYQYFPYPTSYDLRFDILYLLENLALVAAAGILALRVQGPWKSVYLHVLGACTLYALSSTVANLAIDAGGYVNGKLYGLGLTASVCWFVWIPLRARQIAGAESKPDQSTSTSRASSWAMLMVVGISVPIVWELLHREEAIGMRTVRLLVAIAAIVGLACAAYLREYMAKLDLASHVALADNRLRLAMESGKTVGWDWDVKSGRDAWFGDLKTMFGIPSDSYVVRVEDFHRRIHPEDRGKVAKAVGEARQTRRPYESEFRVLWPDGTVRWVAASGAFHYAANGEPERMLGMAVDITDRKQAEARLRESEERLRQAAQAGRMYAFEWDVATDVIVRSAECADILDWSQDPTVDTGKQFVASIHPDDRERYAAVEKALTPSDPTYQLTFRVVRPEGALIWLEESGRASFDSEGKLLRVMGMVADDTERKLAEEALSSVSRRVIEAEERERSRVARDLHEDIGQRLALLAIEIEQLKNDPPDQAEELLGRMDAVWRQTLEVLTDVKASAHELHSPRLQYLGLAAAMRSFCEEFGARRSVEIDFRSQDLHGPVSPDISLCLFRVLQEALHNALTHSGVQRFEVRLWRQSEEVNLTVSDRGVGFEADAVTKARSMGLIGMRERLKLLKGTFSIESQLKRGTTIHARIPLSSASDSLRAAG